MVELILSLLILSSIATCDGGILDRIRQCNKIKDTCNFCREMNENNLETAHSWIMTGLSREQKKLPVPNFSLAMEGYDVIAGNHFQNPDPGRRKQIFDPLRHENGRIYVNTFIDDIDSEVDCDADIVVVPVKNEKDFIKSTVFGPSMYLGNFSRYETERSNMPLPFSYDSDDKSLAFVGKTHCITASVSISPFEMPVFTERFVNALKIFNEAAKTPLLIRSRDVAITFFKTFGTHFMKSVRLGSKILFGKKFTSASSSTEHEKQRIACVLQKSKQSLQEGKGDVDVLQNKFDILVSACEENTNNLPQTITENPDESNNRHQTFVIGNLPKQTLNTWSTDAIENPIPVEFQLIKVSYLFRQHWLDSLSKKDEEKMNAEMMYSFFEKSLFQYCKTILGADCKVDAPETDINFHFLNDEGFNNDKTNQHDQIKALEAFIGEKNEGKPLTFDDMKDPAITNTNHDEGKNLKESSGVFIHGGFEDLTVLRSVEVISTPLAVNIPDTPTEMAGHSLAAIGTSLYACGNSIPWKRSAPAGHNCFKLDTSNSNPEWVSSSPLPNNITRYHVSIAFHNSIWYFTYNLSRLYIFNPESGEFTHHNIPFVYNETACLASNGDSIYYIDTYTGFIFSLIEPNAPETWSRVHLPSLKMQMFPKCLLIAADILVTGGNGISHPKNFMSIDLESYEVRNISHFVQARMGYSMFILDGRPAVAGGVQGITTLDTIETYSFILNEWTVHPTKLLRPRAYYALAQSDQINMSSSELK